ncbi:MAG: hypothetical protein K2P14_11370 [Anaeroplasmataceae bacterium]|nr:hypothetical protein [Anaeroplasmataceae bacterium]
MQEKSKPPYYDLKTDIIKLAEDFTEAYKRCIEGKNARIDEYGRHVMSVVNIPAIVNASFACELYLKAILKESLKEHQLKVLYEKLPKSQQERIKNQMDEKLKDLPIYNSFEESLDKASISFVEWRYIYETEKSDGFMGNRINLLLQFFACFLNILKNEINDR